MKEKVNILVSGICGNSYGAQVAKSLTLLDETYELFGADAVLSTLVNAIQVRKLIQLPKASEDYYLDSLTACYHENSIDYFIEGSESEQKILNDNRDLLSKNKINWITNNKNVIDTCLDKRHLSQFLKNNNFWHPKTFLIEDLVDDCEIFPVILKPHSHSGGSNHVYIAQDIDDVEAILQISREEIDSYIIQEYLGTPDAEYTVGILHNDNGIFIGSATLKRDLSQSLSIKYITKNLTEKHELGGELVISSGFSQGLLQHNQAIEDYCRHIAETLKSSGPLNFQGRLVGDKFYIFEINPRFSGTSFMRALSAFNEADLWIKSINKKAPSSPFYIKSKTLYKRFIKEIREN